MVNVQFGLDGLVPVVAQDATTGLVLMVAYMNQEALERTLQTGRAWYWSRSRKKLWQKGEESGHTQHVRDVRVDCDADALVLVVDQAGPACHTGHQSCFYRTVDGREISTDVRAEEGGDTFESLYQVLRDRRAKLPAGSYSAELFRAGQAKISAKVLEEAEELTRAAREESDQRVVEEAADLLYHSWVLLLDRGIELRAVRSELERRRNGP